MAPVPWPCLTPPCFIAGFPDVLQSRSTCFSFVLSRFSFQFFNHSIAQLPTAKHKPFNP